MSDVTKLSKFRDEELEAEIVRRSFVKKEFEKSERVHQIISLRKILPALRTLMDNDAMTCELNLPEWGPIDSAHEIFDALELETAHLLAETYEFRLILRVDKIA